MFAPWHQLVRVMYRVRGPRPARTWLEQRPTEVLAHVAHEARQPLTAARAAFRMIRDCPDDGRREHACDVLDRQLGRMDQLLDDLLEASWFGLGRMTLQVAAIDLRRLVDESVECVVPQAEDKGQRLELTLPGDPVWIHGDLKRLQQVVSNLLVNSIRYTDTGGHVSVTVSRLPRSAVLKVADNGRGIDAALLPHLFEPFTRGDAASQGLGLGLAIARQIVELHGGTIRASSRGPGSGSTFVVRLPVDG